MKTMVHLVASVILAAVLYPFFKWNVLLILAGGVLIDIDHYFWYVYKYRKFSLFKCYNHYVSQMGEPFQKENIGILLIFHTVEFLLIIFILSFYFKYVLIFAIGLLVHYLLDLVYLLFVPKRFIVNHSIIHWVYKTKLKIQKL